MFAFSTVDQSVLLFLMITHAVYKVCFFPFKRFSILKHSFLVLDLKIVFLFMWTVVSKQTITEFLLIRLKCRAFSLARRKACCGWTILFPCNIFYSFIFGDWYWKIKPASLNSLRLVLLWVPIIKLLVNCWLKWTKSLFSIIFIIIGITLFLSTY